MLAYPSVFVPPTYAPPPEVYQPPPQPYQHPMAMRPTSRHVEGLGLPERWALILPYVPGYIGLVASSLNCSWSSKGDSCSRPCGTGTGSVGFNHGHSAAVSGDRGHHRQQRGVVNLFGLRASCLPGHFHDPRLAGATHRIAPLAELSEWLNKHIDPRPENRNCTFDFLASSCVSLASKYPG